MLPDGSHAQRRLRSWESAERLGKMTKRTMDKAPSVEFTGLAIHLVLSRAE
jgi:hypothetical protein